VPLGQRNDAVFRHHQTPLAFPEFLTATIFLWRSTKSVFTCPCAATLFQVFFFLFSWETCCFRVFDFHSRAIANACRPNFLTQFLPVPLSNFLGIRLSRSLSSVLSTVLCLRAGGFPLPSPSALALSGGLFSSFYTLVRCAVDFMRHPGF